MNIFHIAYYLCKFALAILQHNLILLHYIMKKGFQVFEIGFTGGKHSVSKVYPTWLGAKRVCNLIHRSCPYFKHGVESVEL